MKEGSSLYIHTHSHLTIRCSHYTTDRIQSALVTVVNRKQCLIRYHGISLNNAIVTTVYWWVLEKLCLWCVNRTQSRVRCSDNRIHIYMLIMMTHKTLLYSMCAWVPEPYKERKFKQAGVGGWRRTGRKSSTPHQHSLMHLWVHAHMGKQVYEHVQREPESVIK